jgi:hypothetical protein
MQFQKIEIKIENMKNLWFFNTNRILNSKRVSLSNCSNSFYLTLCVKQQVLNFNNFQNLIQDHFLPKVIWN